ncbi:restriction endonuclease subunit S [Campylobacter sp. CX2-4080-23]|uniref:restriction endonuclease subunit S n=1 Tax=Campylobacter porcelli TaxID=1660073 RepID=UPI002EB707E9|nr:restriction endonuclease subunit S [Campylobacter sp. CX2-4080-23]
MKSPKIRFKEFQNAWNLTTLGKICSFSKGKGYSKNDLIKNGNPIILYGSLYTNYKTIIDKIDTFAKLKENSILSFGDEVVIPSSGETAEDISVASAVKIKNAIVGGDLNILKPKINSIFLAYKLSNGNTKKEISKKAQGKSVVHLYNNDLKDIAIIIPTDLKEQEAIGEFFKKIDEILDLEKLRFKKFENFKKTMLDKLFVASGENTPRLRLGSFTSTWTSINLGELGEIIKGQQINKIDLLPSGKYYVLNGGITPSGYTNLFNTNENIISISEGGNSCGFVNFNKEKFWSGGHNYTLQNLVINTRFLYALLKYREKNIMSLRVGSGLPNIQKSSLLEFKIQIPTDLKEQEAIGEFFKKIDEILELSQNRISKLENIKKYLLNKMFV